MGLYRSKKRVIPYRNEEGVIVRVLVDNNTTKRFTILNQHGESPCLIFYKPVNCCLYNVVRKEVMHEIEWMMPG
jgi:hypothetical protein